MIYSDVFTPKKDAPKAPEPAVETVVEEQPKAEAKPKAKRKAKAKKDT